jgi:hypothetical protein
VTKIISQANIAPKIAGDIIKPNAIAGQNAVRLVASAMPIVDSDSAAVGTPFALKRPKRPKRPKRAGA